jgi:hypothetical protein
VARSVADGLRFEGNSPVRRQPCRDYELRIRNADAAAVIRTRVTLAPPSRAASSSSGRSVSSVQSIESVIPQR